MIEKLLSFLGEKPGCYPFSYPGEEMQKQVQKYFDQQRNKLSASRIQTHYNFGWSMEREEEALAILAQTEILIQEDSKQLLRQWLRYQPDEVLDLMEAYIDFRRYKIQY